MGAPATTRPGHVVLVAPSNVGKTAVAVALGAHVVQGKPVLSMNTKRGAVLHICGEGGDGVKDRVYALLRDVEDAEDYLVMKSRLNLGDPDHVPELIEQLTVMQTRLWRGITNPAMVFTMIFGLWLASMYGGAYGGVPTWLLIKFGLLGLLLGYHHLLSHIHRRILDGTSTWTSKSLRMINEVATLFLVSIVFSLVLILMLSLI